MKLATLRIESPRTRAERLDGALLVVSRAQDRAARVPATLYPSMLSAVEDWDRARPRLEEVSGELEAGRWGDVVDLAKARLMAPLPRTWAWLDGSAYLSHVILARKARGAEPPPDLREVPLMYQGISDTALGPQDDIPLLDPAHGLDFESELALVTTDVPLGTKARDANSCAALLLAMNDVSLRNLISREVRSGFGFLHGKPAKSFAPFAVTPDELGGDWKEGRLHLPLVTRLNGAVFGRPNAGRMHFSFFDLLEHAAKTRRLSAGTILGGGTVSNEEDSVGSSCLAEARAREQLRTGKASTPFLKAGDTVEIEMLREGRSVFGRISQRVIAAR